VRVERGFSLIEMVIAIILLGILAGVLVFLLSGPMRASIDTERRASLVDLAETALARMTRELRLALPNSIRIANAPGVVAVEMLRTLDGGRYRGAPASGPPPACGPAPSGDPLELTCADDRFDVLGQLRRLAQIQVGSDCLATPGTADCLVVFNTGESGANAYAGDNVATITALADDASALDGSDQVSIGNANLSGGLPAFPFASPTQRFHVVDTPVSFVCDTGSGEINRHADYPIALAQTTSPGGVEHLLVNRVAACDFRFDPGSATRGGLITLRITLTEPDSAESVTLLQQVHVGNQP
jgi:MSHA biogenesis protein MshO